MSKKLKLELSDKMYEDALKIIPGLLQVFAVPYFVPGNTPFILIMQREAGLPMWTGMNTLICFVHMVPSLLGTGKRK